MDLGDFDAAIAWWFVNTLLRVSRSLKIKPKYRGKLQTLGIYFVILEPSFCCDDRLEGRGEARGEIF